MQFVYGIVYRVQISEGGRGLKFESIYTEL